MQMPASPESVPLAVNPSREMLLALWQRGLPRLHDRLAELDRATAEALAGTLTAELCQHAADTAHKLSGSLGMFGYTEATGVARDIELLLEAPSPLNPITLQALTTALRHTLNL
jgi:HPt (histidine-containing phosphotransfer) domain-containing protein